MNLADSTATDRSAGPRSGLVGSVESFDADVGLGVVTSEDGRRYRFHCTAIADGSRQINVERMVRFDVRAAGPGHWEAFGLTPQD